MTLHPTVRWAQRREFLFLTVDLGEVMNLKVDLEEKSLKFSATSAKETYEFELKFPFPINKEESKYKAERNVQFKIVKQTPEFWDNITSEGKKHWIMIDWDKWVDADEDEERVDMGMGDFDMGSMNFGGGGDDFDEDSDDEDLRDLDEPSAATENGIPKHHNGRVKTPEEDEEEDGLPEVHAGETDCCK